MNRRFPLYERALAHLCMIVCLGYSTASLGQGTDPIGVVALVNPDALLTREEAEREPTAGDDIFLNDAMVTDANGQVHLMLNDKSSFTVGPNSDVTIDEFVYDPQTSSGDMAFSAVRGVMRFVGGELSKDQPVEIRTSLGTLGIRGGILLLDLADDGGMTAVFSFGTDLSFISSAGLASTLVVRPGFMIQVSPDGDVTGPTPAPREVISGILSRLEGSASTTDEGAQSEGSGASEIAMQTAVRLLAQGITGLRRTDEGDLLIEFDEDLIDVTEDFERRIFETIRETVEMTVVEVMEPVMEEQVEQVIEEMVEEMAVTIDFLINLEQELCTDCITAEALFDAAGTALRDPATNPIEDIDTTPVELRIISAGTVILSNQGGFVLTVSDPEGSFPDVSSACPTEVVTVTVANDNTATATVAGSCE